jgi:acyl dehydratase
MIDYHALILRAVAGLNPNTEETRRLVYERTRAALANHLQALDPPLAETERMQQRLALEEAYRRVEAEVAKAAQSGRTFQEFAHAVFVSESLRRLAGRLDQSPRGAGISRGRDGTLDFAAPTTPGDRATTTVPFFEHRLSEIRRNAEALDALATPMAEEPGWHGLAHAARLTRNLLSQPTDDVAREIAQLWILSTCLAAHIERNEDARSGHLTVSAPLDPNLLQALREFVFVAGPWVRRFPSGRTLDDLAREEEYPPEHVEPAIDFFRLVREAGLVRDDDARAIWIALDAARSLSVPAAKARTWAIATVANIAVAMVKELATVPDDDRHDGGEDVNAPADLAERIERVIRESEGELLILLAPRADDGGAALHEAFAMLEQTPDDEGQPVDE